MEKVSNKINVLRITRKSTGGEYSSFLDGRQILLDIQFARKLINDSLKIVKSKVSNEINVFRLNQQEENIRLFSIKIELEEKFF